MSPDSAPTPPPRMHVLLADDDEFMRLLEAEVLRGMGHEVEAVESGTAAWEAWQRGRHPLVLLDWQMPGLDGLEVARRIRAAETRREAFLLVVTAHDARDGLDPVLDAGADDYLSKPVTPDNLHARLVIAERRIALERAARDAEDALQRAQWLAGIGETTLALQHEINNPLAALLGNATLLEAGIMEEAEKDEIIGIIVEQARRISAVVKRLAALREPRSVEYLQGAKMIDLSDGRESGPA